MDLVTRLANVGQCWTGGEPKPSSLSSCQDFRPYEVSGYRKSAYTSQEIKAVAGSAWHIQSLVQLV